MTERYFLSSYKIIQIHIYVFLTNKLCLKSKQGNQDSSGNQHNVIQGQRPDIENRQIQQRTQSNQNHSYKVTKVNEQLELH